jgi:tRNA(Ile2) C34 agmatinyltransferase TiaS
MSGRIYDLLGTPYCKKCGSQMLSSAERNFNGPRCKSKKCGGGLLDAEYRDEKGEKVTILNYIKK